MTNKGAHSDIPEDLLPAMVKEGTFASNVYAQNLIYR